MRGPVWGGLKGHKEQLFSFSAELAATENVEMTAKPTHPKMSTTMINDIHNTENDTTNQGQIGYVT